MAKKPWFAAIYRMPDGAIVTRYQRGSPKPQPEGKLIEVLSGEDHKELFKRAKKFIKERVGKE